MNIGDILQKLKHDPRNKHYTDDGLEPVLQINDKARILIIGQAPGRKAEQSHTPFNDASGKKLIEWLGIDRQTFYSQKLSIMPMDFYYPGKGKSGDLPPRKFIAEDYHQQLLSYMPDIRLTVLVGKYAIDYYLKDRKKNNLTQTVNSFSDYLPDYFPIVHPSPLNFRWQLKNPWFERDVIPKLREYVEMALT